MTTRSTPNSPPDLTEAIPFPGKAVQSLELAREFQFARKEQDSIDREEQQRLERLGPPKQFD